ncbi:unnamed protein product [Brassica rapa subsp. trilocularis]
MSSGSDVIRDGGSFVILCPRFGRHPSSEIKSHKTLILRFHIFQGGCRTVRLDAKQTKATTCCLQL